jgi:LPS O-antigen subunit length determinant protein (WzzB/FepE family)
MGKHEIRIRRQRMSARGSERFRNYNSILKQHDESKRIKTIIRIFTFFFIIVALILIFVAVSRWEKKQTESEKKSSPKIVSVSR